MPKGAISPLSTRLGVTQEVLTPRQLSEIDAVAIAARWFQAEDKERVADLASRRSANLDIDCYLAALGGRRLPMADLHSVIIRTTLLRSAIRWTLWTTRREIDANHIGIERNHAALR